MGRMEPTQFLALYAQYDGRLIAIAEAAGVSYTTVRRYRRRLGLPVRRHGWPPEAAARSAARKRASLPSVFLAASAADLAATVERLGSLTQAAASYGVSRQLVRRAVRGWSCRS